jgi:hypothetical protein
MLTFLYFFSGTFFRLQESGKTQEAAALDEEEDEEEARGSDVADSNVCNDEKDIDILDDGEKVN